jgi:electron transport complex protein RnfB
VNHATLAERIAAALPQTQCRRCGYADCDAYAQAIASGEAAIDRCPPGGRQGVERLAAITGQAARALDPGCGAEAPRALASIDEAWCIGCTLCIQACPVDCIVGAARRMHTVIGERCTGCELCLPACPVDCISMTPVSGSRTGWDAWSAEQASAARARYTAHRQREQALETVRMPPEPEPAPEPASAASPGAACASPGAPSATGEITPGAHPGSHPGPGPGLEPQVERKQALVAAALARARSQRAAASATAAVDRKGSGS